MADKCARNIAKLTLGAASALLLFGIARPTPAFAQDVTYDVVIVNGRVMDPESGLDAVRNVGIGGGKIRAISSGALKGKQIIYAKGLVVSPGFIDLHQHGQDAENYAAKAHDGVTTALELEVGVACMGIIEYAFEYARREKRKKVTLAPLASAGTLATFSTNVGSALYGWRCGSTATITSSPS